MGWNDEAICFNILFSISCSRYLEITILSEENSCSNFWFKHIVFSSEIIPEEVTSMYNPKMKSWKEFQWYCVLNSTLSRLSALEQTWVVDIN